MLTKLLAVAILAIGALDVGAAVAVVKLHATAARHSSGAGLISRHVVLVATGHMLLVVGVMLAMLDVLLRSVKLPIAVYLAPVGAGMVLTLLALGVIGRVQQARTRQAAARAAVTPLRMRAAHRRKGTR